MNDEYENYFNDLQKQIENSDWKYYEIYWGVEIAYYFGMFDSNSFPQYKEVTLDYIKNLVDEWYDNEYIWQQINEELVDFVNDNLL